MVAIFRESGDKTKVAREMGVSRTTVKKYLHAQGFFGTGVTGKLNGIEPIDLPVPAEGEIKRYILTSAQNNTKLHGGFWANLIAYTNFLDAKLMVARFTYDKSSYGAKAVKPGKEAKATDKDEAWWDPAIAPFLCDDVPSDKDARYRLAPGLQWCAEMNILPTAVKPLTGLDNYTGRETAIFPHAALAMGSVATARSEPTKFNYTTGTVTVRNYIAKKEGLKAASRHSYSALIVEVNSDGEWWVRQLEAQEDGTFYDVPDVTPFGNSVKVSFGQVTEEHSIEAINWGDIHASEIDEDVKELNWGDGGIIDQLKPRHQIMHDIQNFRSRSHHEVKKFGKMFLKHINGVEIVEDEVKVTAALANLADRADTDMIIVSSNHDRHLEQWLDESDFRKDLPNARYYLKAQLARVTAYENGEDWDGNEWSLEDAGVPSDVIFLKQDDSYIIAGIEMAMHGDEGPNGSRGSTMNLGKLGQKVNKGHDHTATILGDVWSAGACQLRFGYQSGPSSHSVSHIITFPGGTRSIVTIWEGKWRA